MKASKKSLADLVTDPADMLRDVIGSMMRQRLRSTGNGGDYVNRTD